MTRPFLVLENLDTVSRHELSRFLGTRWVATRFAYLSPVFWCTLGLAVALLTDGSGSITRSLLSGLAYGLMSIAANTIHSARAAAKR